MPSQPKRHRTSKLFQCTGYGKCTMTFTRGEHLARHTRKHTGEKPFVCISPNCNKAFSRFDNMMQHTQTHRHEAQHLMQQPYHHQLPPAQPIITTMDKVILRQPTLINHKPAFHPVSAIHSSNTSLSGYSYCSSDNDDDDDDDDNDEVDDEDVGPRLLNSYFEPKVHDSWMPSGHRRRLSVADLCNPMDPSPSKIHQLTHDEVEALQAFGKLCQATC